MELWLEGWRTHHQTGNHISFVVTDEDLEYFKAATVRKGKIAGQRYQAVLVELNDAEEPVTPPPVVEKPPKKESAAMKAAREAAEFAAKTVDLPFEEQPDGSMARTVEGTVELPGGTVGVPYVAPEPQEAPPPLVDVSHLSDRPKAANDPTPEDDADRAFGQPHRGHGPRFPTGLCGLAVQWCEDDHFCAWLSTERKDEWDEFPENAADDQRAKGIICSACGITSRKELDTNPGAGDRFRYEFLDPYKEQRATDGMDGEPASEQLDVDEVPF